MSVLSAYTKFCQKIFLLSLVLLILHPNTSNAKSFDAKTFTLDNGMQVVLIENHRAPVVSHMVWYKIGAADEPRGKSGVAHFLEHLMFTGTDKIPPGTFSETIKKNGGQDNAFTSQDYTAYYQNIAVEKLPMVMKMEADRMQNLKLDADIVARERKVVLEERNQRTDNNPSALLHEELYSTLFVNHPYATPIIGWRHEIEQLSLEQALDFYHAHYRPGNAILVISGDITLEKLKTLAKEYYGVLNNPKNTDIRHLREWSTPAPLKAEHRIIYRDNKVKIPSYQKLYRAPHGSEALEIMSNILGEGATSRLYKKLVVEEKLATEVGTSYDSIEYGPAVFGIYARPAPNIDIKKLEQRIDDLISEITTHGVTNDELHTAKNKLISSAIYARDSLQYPAMIFGRALTAGFDIDDIENWTDNIQAVTKQEILTETQNVFAGKSMGITGLLLPQKELIIDDK